MLGEIIYEAKGNVTGIRVLDVEGGIPKIETTISQNGNLRRTEIPVMVTYVSIPRSSEVGGGEGRTVFYAEGQGVLMTKYGTEMATWTGQGIAHSSGKKRTVSTNGYNLSMNWLIGMESAIIYVSLSFFLYFIPLMSR